MTLKGGTSQACAACKYQRKRCTPECALAPHFRPEQTEIFKNAHKLFGVRNILRILEQIDPSQKTEAMRSIIYQANMRDRSPVHGCLGVIYQLQYQIRQAEKELYAVLSQLEYYKQNQRRQHEITLSPMDSSPESQQLQLALPISFSGNENVNDGYNTSNNVMHNESKDNMNMKEVTHDYDELYPFFDTIDDTQSYIDSNKEPNESSSESSLKETTQSVQMLNSNLEL
nr:hypothetical protein [Tanacetum cinerariifolium]